MDNAREMRTDIVARKAEIEERCEASGTLLGDYEFEESEARGTPFLVSDSGVGRGVSFGEEGQEGRGVEVGGGGIGGFKRGSVLTAYAAPQPPILNPKP